MKKIFYLIIFLFIFISCEKDNFDIINLNNDIILLGHGGMGRSNVYPMNTFESIIKSLYSGLDGTEIDVQLTKDNVLIAFHDRKLDDNTNLSGIVNSLNWNEIKGGKYIGTHYLDYSIISLEQLFSRIENKYKFTFDCKLYHGQDSIKFYNSYINSLIDIIDKYGLENNIYIESESEYFLSILKEKKPTYKLFIYPKTFEQGLDIAMNMGLYGITISTRDVTKKQINIAHNNNLYVAIWNIQSKNEHIDGINKNPDFIQSDNSKYLLNLL